MTRPDPICPICDGTRFSTTPVVHYEPLTVAGVLANFGDTARELLTCERCEYKFKWPSPPPDEIERCYRESAASTWESPDPIERRFDELSLDLAHHQPGGNVLDVGCAGGEFLLTLPPSFTPYGLEPGAAGQVAQSKGIEVLGSFLDDLGHEYDQFFDAIVCLDVLEHVVDGRTFMAQVARLLKPDGVFLALTGNTDALSWRLERGAYWYCAMPEHISFYNVASMERLFATAGLRKVASRTTQHKRYTSTTYASQTIKGIVYVVAKALPLPPSISRSLDRPAPYWEAARNHMVVIGRR